MAGFILIAAFLAAAREFSARVGAGTRCFYTENKQQCWYSPLLETALHKIGDTEALPGSL